MDSDRLESAPAAEPTTAPIVLSYADAVTQFGVIVVDDGQRLKVIVPPVPNWRHLHRGYFIGGAILLVLLAAFAGLAIARHDASLINGVLPNLGSLLFFDALFIFYRLHRRVIFELTEEHFLIILRTPWFTRQQAVYFRRDIGGITMNHLTGQLLVRVTGKDLLEYFISDDRRVTQWVADVLSERLLRPADALAADQPLQAEILGYRPPTRARRLGLIGLTIAMLAAALICFCFGFPFTLIGFYLLILSGAPVGIALGTQNKDYYFF